MIKLEDVTLRIGQLTLENLAFQVPSGGYAALMGKTGSGKTTILEAIGGLRQPTSGKIFLLDQDVTGLKPAQRGLGYVPQDRALFKTMTVWEHLAFALVIRKWDRRAIAQRAQELADWLGLGHLLDRKPAGLSGGEAQRVALGRALSFKPAILLLDEPLAALDTQTKEEMSALLHSVRRHTGATILHVTHDFQEAARLADLVFVLQDGKIQPSAPPAVSPGPSIFFESRAQ